MFTEAKLFHKAGEGSGGGGSDPHNLGWYATSSALQTAHPTATDGDWAIVGATDTVWVWDSDTTAWKDSDQKGQVTSVNGQTGDVTVQATLVSGTNIKSVDGNSLLGSGNLELSTYLTYPAGWTTNSTTVAFCADIAADSSAVKGKAYLGEVTINDLPASMANGEIVVEIMDGTTAADKVIVLSLKSGNVSPYAWQYVYWNNGSNTSGWQTWQEPLVSGTNIKTINGTSLLGSGDITTEAIQVSSMPTAAADELGKVYQFIGTTDANYTHGYFYECVSDGATPPVYSWSNVQVQAGGSSYTAGTGIDITSGVISVVNPVVLASGTSTLPSTDSTEGLAIGAGAFAGKQYGAGNYTMAIGISANAKNNSAMAIGHGAIAGSTALSIGHEARGNTGGVAIGHHLSAGNKGVILGANGGAEITGTAKAFDIVLNNTKYNLVQEGGTIPTDRLVHAINKYSSMPTAASTNEGWIVQYTGTTDSTYTHGYIYECVSDGGNPATYSWSAINVQAGGGGSLPSQTGNAGKFLTTDGTDASWGNALANTAVSTTGLAITGTTLTSNAWRSVVIGQNATLTNADYAESVLIGYNTRASQSYNILIGGCSSGSSYLFSSGRNNIALVPQSSNISGTDNILIGGSSMAVSSSYSVVLGQISGGSPLYGNIILGSGGIGSVLSDNDPGSFWILSKPSYSTQASFKMLSSDGTIPADRLASTTGLADGNYRLRLTMASGVPTLSWVAE